MPQTGWPIDKRNYPDSSGGWKSGIEEPAQSDEDEDVLIVAQLAFGCVLTWQKERGEGGLAHFYFSKNTNLS